MVGLRVLDERWSTDNLHNFPRGKDGVAVLSREKLLSDLLAGTVRLKAVVSDDVAALQSDLIKLNLRQLLRLHALLLNFIQSECESNTVTGVGSTLAALYTVLDTLLFKLLGAVATQPCVPSSFTPSLRADDRRRHGQEAAEFVMADKAAPSPGWWC